MVKQILLAASFLALAGCATHFAPEHRDDPYGFFSGIWHGMIFPFALFTNLVSWALSLIGINFLTSIEIIGRPNTGFFYYFGFVLGLGVFGGGGGSASRQR